MVPIPRVFVILISSIVMGCSYRIPVGQYISKDSEVSLGIEQSENKCFLIIGGSIDAHGGECRIVKIDNENFILYLPGKNGELDEKYSFQGLYNHENMTIKLTAEIGTVTLVKQ